MNKELVNFIVRKYLKFDKKNPFIGLSAILAFLGVCIGVMVLLISMAIMSGTAHEFESKLSTMNYPLSIYPKIDGSVNTSLLEKLENKFPNLKFSPYLSSQVILQKGNSLNGGMLFGVNPKKEEAINSIYAKHTRGLKFSKYDIIVGQSIKNNFFLYKGAKLSLYFNSIDPSGFSVLPKIKRFTYKSYFKSGLNAYDKSYMYTSLGALRTILHKNKNYFDGIHIYSSQPFEDIKLLRTYLKGSYTGIVGWWQQNGSFFSAMEMEKKALFIVLMLIILVASLNIISSLLMTVMSRRKEIALLLSLGANKKEIQAIFMRLGMIIGFGGIIIGTLLGFLGIYVLGHFNIVSLPADVYGTSKLPLDLSLNDFLYIIFGSIVIVFLSTYYPAKKATKLDVIDVLRNE